jgi:hypothetical protein
MTHVPLTDELIEEIAKLGDDFAALVRSWKSTAKAAKAAHAETPTVNGIQDVRGKAQRALEAAEDFSPKIDIIQKRAARAAGTDTHAATKPRKKGA